MALLKQFRYSYVFLVCSLLAFWSSFLNYENGLYITLVFFLIINLTCFSNEYLVIQYYKKTNQKNFNKGYALFIMIQVLITLIIFFVFQFVFA